MNELGRKHCTLKGPGQHQCFALIDLFDTLYSFVSDVEKLKMATREGVATQWYYPLTLKSEQSGGVGSSPGRTPPLEGHDKGSLTRLGLLYFCARNHNFAFNNGSNDVIIIG